MPLVRKPPGPPPTTAPASDLAAMLQLLAGGSDEERWSAARAAADVPDSVAALGEALARETSTRVRQAIFTSLARIATPQSVDVVRGYLRSDDAHARTDACDALIAMGEAAWPYLGTLLRDHDADVRALACGLVRNMPSEVAVPLFCELLNLEPDANVCAAAIDALAEIGGPEALPVLERCHERFRATPFLAFAITIAADRIRAQSASPRA
ncbi:MAG: HEAT repeat domain-containing protein [Gammaproteobacteria bacterium]